MAKRDLETIIFDLEALVKANLPAKLLAIDADKGDGITLTQIPDAAYFFQDLKQSDAAAYPAFISFGIEDPTPEGIGPSTSEATEIFFVVVLQGDGTPRDIYKKLLRYMRGLKEIFQENFDKIPSTSRLIVSSLSPVAIVAPTTNWSFRAAGVKIRAVIA